MDDLRRPLLLSILLILILGPVSSQIAWSGSGAIPVSGADVSEDAQYKDQGVLNIIYGDGFDRTSETRYYLSKADGTNIRLLFSSPPSFAFFSKMVVVTGTTPSQRALANEQVETTMLVDNITLPEAAAAQGDVGVTLGDVSGTKNMIILLLKYSDDSSVPHDVSFYTNLINPGSGNTVNTFYQTTSWGRLSIHADTTTGWLTLPQPKSYYAPCGWSGVCLAINTLSSDAITLADSQVNFANYDMISFVVSNDFDCCAWGGGWYGTLDGVTKLWGATWMPPWSQEAGTYSHEVGHSIGAPHSGWVYWAYDSPWDVMSGGDNYDGAVCGSYYSRNNGGTTSLWCYMPGDMIAAYKDMLGWIDSGHMLTVASGSMALATVDSLAAALSSNYKMLKLCISGYSCVSGGSTSRYVTVEVRTHTGYDQYLPGEGVILHMFQGDRPAVSGTCFFNSQSGPAYPIDSTPGDYDSVNCNSGGRSYPNYALFNAQWSVGQEYSSVATLGANRRLVVVSQTGASPNAVTFTIRIMPFTVGIIITSSPGTGSGYVTVDSTPTATPQTFSWEVGSNHTVAATLTVSCGSSCQYVFVSWSDSGTQTHVIMVPSSPTTYTANYKTQYQLTIAVSPSGGGSTNPSVGAYWYDSGTSVPVSATVASGYSFYYWSLDGTNVGTSPSYSALMNSAHTLTAVFRGTSSISVSMSVAPDGFAWIISGTITPTQPSPGISTGTPVALSYSSDSGGTWSNFITVLTSSAGDYSVYWQQPYQYADLRVRASWNGNAAYEGSISSYQMMSGTYGPFYPPVSVLVSGSGSVARGGSATFDVIVTSPSSYTFDRTLYIIVVGPDGYQYIDTVRAAVNAGETKRYQFIWQTPSSLTTGTYQVYAGLIPPNPAALGQTQIVVT